MQLNMDGQNGNQKVLFYPHDTHLETTQCWREDKGALSSLNVMQHPDDLVVLNITILLHRQGTMAKKNNK